MGRSLRLRLQFWYGLVLSAVVGGFALLLYYEVRSSRLAEIDADLYAAANYLDSVLRNFQTEQQPRKEREPEPPPRKDRDKEKDWDREKERPKDWPGKKGGPPPNRPGPPPIPVERSAPPPVPIERLLGELVPPGWPGESTGQKDRYFAVWREGDAPIKAVDLPADTTKPADDGTMSSGSLLYFWLGNDRRAAMLGPRHAMILVGRDTGKLVQELRTFAWQLGVSGGGVLFVGLLGGWVFSRRIFQPIARISKTASRISADNLSERIETVRIDYELAALGEVLNGAFDRLEGAFAQQRRFTADASHELRTPLAIIKSHAELALSRERTPAQYRETLEACHKAADRMAAIVDGLLTLTRTDAGQLSVRPEPVNLAEIVTESLSLLKPLAEERGLRLATELHSAYVVGDAGALAQLTRNLIHNAIQYNRPSGSVKIAVRTREGEAILSVADKGIGIPEADRPHIFERFYRVDKARSRASGGTGLGLAICKSIVTAHGGTIGFESSERGTRFLVAIPKKG